MQLMEAVGLDGLYLDSDGPVYVPCVASNLPLNDLPGSPIIGHCR